ncbi:hypothetical protein PTTG_25947 [Puccinia triticina 1-1 BBBD Race 1]|uniref:BZIP domain-containing protein n=1 Tax=Puccinia triticina (isolate 1-1 / race 1 (BBBD)) TaxID=630390 RepID=A0A180GYB8_PUCT1|nr:hypothetical protein PTTG_25947 [Puccinia triticina 1-1 BBBD Race 1]
MDDTNDQNRTPTRPAPQPTRSGRIPQRPTSTISLNPLDFLEFPDESESDDPDFDPLSSQAQPARDFFSTQTYPALAPAPLDSLAQQAEPVGFDFSTLCDHPEPLTAWPPLDSLSIDPSNPFNQFQPTSATLANPSPKLSPLTQGELAGVPFVNINLPESDDSPEFIPPPTTRSSAAAAAAAASSSSSRPSKRPRRETNIPDQNTAQWQESSSSTRTQPTTAPSRKSIPLSTCSSTQLPASISSRYIAIAPTPNYTAEQYDTIEDSEDDGPSDHLSSRPELVQRNATIRAQPMPKPRKPLSSTTIRPNQHDPPSTIDHEIGDREDSMKRKREGMRKNRERKKIYIVSLEDRCLELAEENARLREENQQLIRESRENWKAKAKSLEVFKLLNQQIQRLQASSAATSTESGSSRSSSQRQQQQQQQQQLQYRDRQAEPRQALKRKAELDENHLLALAPRTRDPQLPLPSTSSTSKRTSLPPSSSLPLRYPSHNSARGRTLLDVLSSKPKSS